MDPVRQARRKGYVVSGLQDFYGGIGIKDPPLSVPVIEGYCVTGLCGRRPSTRGTYRSVLRQVSGQARPAVAAGFPGSRAAPPYSPGERAELWSIARCQRTEFRRNSTLAVISLGLGAGLRSGEIIAARGHDVSPMGRGRVELHVGADPGRIVAVGGEAGKVLLALSGDVGGGYLFHPSDADRSYPNFVNDFCRRVVSDPSAPFLSVARLRSSFVSDHLVAGTPLAEILEITGIVEVESLLYYSRQVPSAPRSKAALRQALGKR